MTRAGDWLLEAKLGGEPIKHGSQAVAVRCPAGSFERERDGVFTCEACIDGAICDESGLKFQMLPQPASK